ncbi:MAG: branched-chain amino acid transport system permease protein [Paracoccaceae bacterium]|jgi:branched-chain amino acid transport system permease protein
MTAREWIVTAALALALLLGAVWADAVGEPYYVNMASRIAIMALASAGLNLALGHGGMVSFGHAAFFGIGGYAAGIAATHAMNFDPIMTWPLTIEGTDRMPVIWLSAMLASAVVALGIGALSLRTSGVHFIMITLAFAQMVYYFAISWPEYGGEDGLPIYVRNGFPGLDTYDALTFFGLAFGLLMAVLALTHVIMNARFGAALTMARLNPARLATAGIAPYPVKLAAFALSAAITGLAGALLADLNGFVGPNTMSWHMSGELIVLVILGGVGRLAGPIAGAATLIGMEVIVGGYTQRWQLALGVVLLLVVLFARGGIVGALAGKARHD